MNFIVGLILKFIPQFLIVNRLLLLQVHIISNRLLYSLVNLGNFFVFIVDLCLCILHKSSIKFGVTELMYNVQTSALLGLMYKPLQSSAQKKTLNNLHRKFATWGICWKPRENWHKNSNMNLMCWICTYADPKYSLQITCKKCYSFKLLHVKMTTIKRTEESSQATYIETLETTYISTSPQK